MIFNKTYLYVNEEFDWEKEGFLLGTEIAHMAANLPTWVADPDDSMFYDENGSGEIHKAAEGFVYTLGGQIVGTYDTIMAVVETIAGNSDDFVDDVEDDYDELTAEELDFSVNDIADVFND